MSVSAKIFRVISGILLILVGGFLTLTAGGDEVGLALIMVGMAVWLIALGIRLLNFYSRMARFMVGGKLILLLGFLIFDFGMFNLSLYDVHAIFIVLYLLGFYAFNGAIDVMRAFEQKKYETSWKLKLATGIVEISVALTALIGGLIARSGFVVVVVVGLGIVYTGVVRIITAFRKTTMMSIL